MHIPIVLAADDHFAMACGVLMQSVLQTTSKPVRFALFHSHITAVNMSRLREVVSQRSDCELQLIDAEERLRPLPIPARSDLYSRMIYARLAAPDLLADDRAIYLDADTLVKEDLARLFEWDMQGRPLAAVRDFCAERASLKDEEQRRYFRDKVHGRRVNDYFNSGVLLMDLEQFRRRRLGAQAIQLIHDNPALLFPDQDALNLVVDGDVVYLPERWNALASEQQSAVNPALPKLLRNRVQAAFDDPAVIHYIVHKPWSPFPVNFRREYLDAVKQTPWKQLNISTRGMNLKSRIRLIKAWRSRLIRFRIRKDEIALHMLGRPMFHWPQAA